MDNVSRVIELESVKSLRSAISKSERALAHMAQKGASTALLERRLKALYIGLAVLEDAWNQSPHHYTQHDLAEARNVLAGLFPSIESIYARLETGSP